MNNLNLYETIPFDEYQIRILAPGDAVPTGLHWHEHTEIHFMVSGTLKFRCGDKILNLKKNDCAVINANELHEGLDGKDCMSFRIILPPSFFENNHCIFESFFNDETVTRLMTEMITLSKSKELYDRFNVKGCTYLLISHLLKYHTEQSLSEYNYHIYRDKLNKINTAVRYISENYTDDISTEELAKIVHLSRSHFCHIFKDVFGMSAKEYLLSIRVQKACQLLKTSDLNITDIAFFCGFSDANYFARVFKKIKTVSPTEYKRLLKK